MKHCIATVSLSGTLYQKIEAISEAGFQGIELFENDIVTSPHTPLDIKQYCQQHGLEIMLYQPFRNFEGHPRDKLSLQLNRARKKFDLMASMGIPKILVCSSVLPETSQSFDIITEDLLTLAEIAKEYGIEVGYEALAWGSVVYSYHQAWEIVKEVNHPNLGIILDSFHTLCINDNLSLLEKIPGNKISFLQLADGPILKMDVLPWSRHYRNFPGQGEFPLDKFLAPILKAGYKGPLSLEIFNDNFRAIPPKETALDARRSLLYLESITYQELLKFQQNIPIEKIEINIPPKDVHYTKIAFLEFAAFNDCAIQLKNWLSILGFSHRGTHKYKNISFFQHGGVKIFINEEFDSYAYAHYLKHGTSLSSIAFVVNQPEAIYNNAKHYLYPFMRHPAYLKKNQYQAVWAPDQSLHYFYPPNSNEYLKEFILLDPFDSKQSTLLINIDHYALGLPSESLSSWLLYYRSVLNLRSEVELSLPELHGSMKSRLLRSKDGVINIPLNLTNDKSTQLGQTVSLTNGSGIQHIALQTNNIIEFITKAKDKGMRFLSIPDNYYDDLSARFDLNEDFLQLLKTHQILYDEDNNGGSLLHTYTLQFSERFSIEIIERRNAYQEYGSSNTHVRIASSLNNN